MKEEKVSSGSIVTLQAVVSCIGVLIVIGLGYLFINLNLDTTAKIILLFILSILFVGVYRIFRFADIYKCGNKIICKKFLKSKERDMSEIQCIDEGFRPLNYIVVFRDGSKVLFQVSVIELSNKLLNSKDDILTRLYSLFEVKLPNRQS